MIAAPSTNLGWISLLRTRKESAPEAARCAVPASGTSDRSTGQRLRAAVRLPRQLSAVRDRLALIGA